MKEFTFLLSFLFSSNTFSQVTVIEPLNFGTIVVVKNTASSSITLFPNGASTSNNIHFIERGHPAELLLEGFGARVQVNISDTGSQPSLRRVNSGNVFTLTNLIYPNSTITTNSYGMATLKIGGQLNASGNGQSYLDDQYSTTVEITIAY